MGLFDSLKKWDFYKKIPEDLTISTLPGISLSIIGCFIMLILFILEFNSYLTIHYKSDIIMDQGLDEMMRINFNVTIPDLRCEFASIDVSDMTGTRKHNMTKDIVKIRLDSKQRMIAVSSEEQPRPIYAKDSDYGDLPESDAVAVLLNDNTFSSFLKEHQFVAVDFYAPWCIWCQRLEPIWTRTAKTLPQLHVGQRVRLASVDCQEHPQLCSMQNVRAYPTIMFYKDGNNVPVEMYHGDRTVEAFTQKLKNLMQGEEDYGEKRKKELHEDDKKKANEEGKIISNTPGAEGCQIFGHLDVKRVPGNFHIHLSNPSYSSDLSLVNGSHIIGELWFGEHLSYDDYHKLPKDAHAELYSHRLEGKTFTAYQTNHTYVHYIKIVTYSYVQGKNQKDINLYKYTAHSNEYLETDDLPSVMFRYDLSPMSVKISKQKQPFYHFLTNACAIIGGVFTVIGIIDQIIHQTIRALNKKIL